MPNVFVIGGCNGAGKTTASLGILPALLNCQEFVNADAIAAGLSPLNPDSVAVMAGRMMLQRTLRVASGGHSIPEDTIRRRYDRGRRNLVELYLPLADTWMVFDNTQNPSELVAQSLAMGTQIIHNEANWSQITVGSV
jgi:predicted ABC-type ATPase